MKNTFKLLVGIFIATTFIISGCEKDSSDPSDKFVGNYSYTFTSPELGNGTGDLKITKTSANTISMLPSDGTPTPYIVDGNNVTEESGQIGEIYFDDGSAITYTENSTGSISGNILTINGNYTNPSNPTLTFKVVATKK